MMRMNLTDIMLSERSRTQEVGTWTSTCINFKTKQIISDKDQNNDQSEWWELIESVHKKFFRGADILSVKKKKNDATLASLHRMLHMYKIHRGRQFVHLIVRKAIPE